MDRIDITDIDLRKFVQRVYELSVPQGLGFLQATSDGLSDEEIDTILSGNLYMDYVLGRACKLCGSLSEEGRLTIPNTWYDHTDKQFEKLLSEFGLSRESKTKHGTACNCKDCQAKRETAPAS